MLFDLNQRHQQILRATIRQYIATAEPVGSKTLVDGYNLNVSPATIRSGFATLEKAGFLYQPHTSAGRVPSDSGYRVYVDRLMQPSPTIGRQVEELFTDKLDWNRWSLEAVLHGAAEILATLSGYVTMITLPQTRHSTIEHIQLVRLESAKVMLILVLDSYQTQSSTIVHLPQAEDRPLDENALDRELQMLSNFLNSQLRGKSVLEIVTLDWSKLDSIANLLGVDRIAPVEKQELPQYVELVNTLLANLAQQAQPIHSTQIMIRGIAEVLCQPEFSQLQQVKTLLHLLESEQERIWELIFDPQLTNLIDDRPKITIRIGAENPLEPMQTCTLISTTYQQDSIPVGSVGLLGPKRMLYEDAIALVRSAADYISDAIAHK
jgi:heat-inducible transcriptional repressor